MPNGALHLWVIAAIRRDIPLALAVLRLHSMPDRDRLCRLRLPIPAPYPHLPAPYSPAQALLLTTRPPLPLSARVRTSKNDKVFP